MFERIYECFSFYCFKKNVYVNICKYLHGGQYMNSYVQFLLFFEVFYVNVLCTINYDLHLLSIWIL